MGSVQRPNLNLKSPDSNHASFNDDGSKLRRCQLQLQSIVLQNESTLRAKMLCTGVGWGLTGANMLRTCAGWGLVGANMLRTGVGWGLRVGVTDTEPESMTGSSETVLK